MKKNLLLILSVLIIFGSAVFFACSKTETAKNSVKIGALLWSGNSSGLDMQHGLEIITDLVNKKGGLSVGGEKYKIDLIIYDTNNSQATAQSALNRLIFEDNVKFILSDPMFVESYVPITEKNKVILSVGANTPVILDPKYHYCFNTSFTNVVAPVLLGWMAGKHPELKYLVSALPDNQIGHMISGFEAQNAKAFGFKYQSQFYPPNSQDLSALGTKIKTLNPDIFSCGGGGAMLDGLAYKAAVQAGYKGQLFSEATTPVARLSQVVPIEALEGFTCAAWAAEFDPALTEPAKEFKEAYIDKYGKWDGPEIQFVATLSAVITAIEKAGSMETDKVADALSNGLKFEGPFGSAQMISRPDMGNNRTVDSLISYPMKKIVNGKPVLIETISAEDGLEYFRKTLRK